MINLLHGDCLEQMKTLDNASDKAEAFIREWTCAESLKELEMDNWSTSDLHSIITDFILSQNHK